MDHCISFLIEERRRKSEMYYLADCLRIITENTARFVPEGTYITRRLYEIGDKKKKTEEPRKGANEIIADVVSRAGLKLKGGG